jgi:hypothetical protein
MLFAYIRNYSHVIGPLRTLQPINSWQADQLLALLVAIVNTYVLLSVAALQHGKKPPNSITTLFSTT